MPIIGMKLEHDFREINTLEFNVLYYKGMINYSDVRLEHLTVSIRTDMTDILEKFDKLLSNMEGHFRKVNIRFLFVCVGGQHIHCIIKKPYIDYDWLKLWWHEITKEQSDIYCKVIRGKKENRQDENVKKLHDYLLYQAQHPTHEFKEIRYYVSPEWGYVKSKKKSKKTKMVKTPDVTSSTGYEEHPIMDIEKTKIKGKKVKTLIQVAYEYKHPVDF